MRAHTLKHWTRELRGITQKITKWIKRVPWLLHTHISSVLLWIDQFTHTIQRQINWFPDFSRNFLFYSHTIYIFKKASIIADVYRYKSNNHSLGCHHNLVKKTNRNESRHNITHHTHKWNTINLSFHFSVIFFFTSSLLIVCVSYVFEWRSKSKSESVCVCACVVWLLCLYTYTIVRWGLSEVCAFFKVYALQIIQFKLNIMWY